MLTIEVSPDGELVKLGDKPVYFSGKPRDVLLHHPKHLHVELGGLVNGWLNRHGFPALKSLGDTWNRGKRIGHVLAEGCLQRAFISLLVIARYMIRH